ncbi:MAG: YfcC family protein [Cyclobacteriaceae bacterium]
MLKDFPSPLTVISIIIVVCAIATWIVPSGKYASITYENTHFRIVSPIGEESMCPANQASLDSLGVSILFESFQNGDINKSVTIPNTYVISDASPQGFVDVIQAPLKGVIETVDIILLVLMIGGFIKIFNETGILEKGTGLLTRKLKGKERWLIIFLTMLMAAGGTTFGLAEETIAFYPILVPVFLAAGYDLIVPLAVVFVGAHIGNMGATVNPFSVVIASNAAGVNWTTGLNVRFIMLASSLVVSLVYILNYAERVRKNPSKSLVLQLEGKVKSHFQVSEHADSRVDKKSGLMLIVFALTFVVMVLGVVLLHWWTVEIAGLFLASSILSAFVLRMKEKQFVNTFLSGAAELVGVTLVIGFARGVTIIMQDGNIIDTILYYLTNLVSGIPQSLFVVGLLVVFFILALLISSTSGLAVVTMPILGALGIAVGVSGDTVVNAYLFGAGLMFLISPTEMILPSIALVNINYNTWLRFILPLMGWLFLLSVVVLLLDLWVM